MNQEQIQQGLEVYDRWFSEWGNGKITWVGKTKFYVEFSIRGKVTYDYDHAQFLELLQVKHGR